MDTYVRTRFFWDTLYICILYAKSKVDAIQHVVEEKVAQVLNVPAAEISHVEEEDIPCKKCEDLDILIIQLKEKCLTVTYKEKVKLLTLLPRSWTIRKTVIKFQVSQHLVKLPDILKETKVA